MTTRCPGRLANAFIVAAAVTAVPLGSSPAQEVQEVIVRNFPELQQVEGAVSVEGPIRHSDLRKLQDVLISPVGPKETTRLIEGGILEIAGFTSVVLSLSGRGQGKVLKPGSVGAILVPDEESIVRTLEEEGQIQFPLEVTAAVESGEPRSFASKQTQHSVGFPRYRVLLYNTSDKTVTVNLFAYLTN
jgi:hypothetical protein